jgi:hypothetical protein
LLDLVWQWLRLSRSNKTLIHMYDRPRDPVHGLTLDASLEFRCGRDLNATAKSRM